ncbi:hypothetical protein [Agaribacterium sp. ZY112]
MSTQFEASFKGLVGRRNTVKHSVEQFGLKQAAGVRCCKALLGA